MNKLTRLKLTSIILFLQICTALHAQEAAAPNWVNKVQKAIAAVTTYDKNGEMLKNGTAFFITADGQAVADYALFNGAYSAMITDQSGQKSKVERILGADDTYALVKFKVNVKKATPVVQAKNRPSMNAIVFALKQTTGKISKCPSATVSATKLINDSIPFYTLSYATDETYLGAPLFNSNGEWIGTIQPSMGLNGYALGAEFVSQLTIKAITSKVNNMALDNIHIPKGLPDSAEESLVYLYIKSQSANNEEYLDMLNLFLDTYPDNAEGYRRRSTVLIDLHRFDEADNDLQSFLKLSDDKPFAYSKIADIIYTKLLYQPTPEYDKWNYDLAVEYIDKALAERPDFIEYQLLKAQILMSGKNYAAALSIFDAINAGEGRSAATLYAASLAHEGLGDSIDIQIELLDSAIATFPTPMPAEAANYVMRRGQLYNIAGRYREAVNEYNQYCFLCNNKVSDLFYYDRSQLELKAKMYQQSLDDIDKAISMAPNIKQYYIDKCALLLHVNMIDECIQAAQQLLAIDADNVDAYRIMGYAQVQKGDTDAGRKNLEHAVQLGDATAKDIIEKYLK